MGEGFRLDEIDLKIIELMQQNSRIPNVEIARKVNMAPSAVLERVKKLEERRVIREYAARVNPKAIGLGLLAFIFVQGECCGPSIGEELSRVPGVLEVHSIAGEDCLLVKVRARDTEDLGRLLNERFKSIPAVRSTKTTIVLTTLKETGSLPLPGKADDE
ncbi:MAG TPA: Lrp/AsnC family transcriptional regulator [Selenomonadales bacterium]|nr:Lrp/AsnC family transcriptional regulator [Selenomonadales bacterium]